MNEKFFDLSREKQDRMINGALEVFSKCGFKHASTDDMVKAVDVSKGLWFHYFGSKLGLYTFVYGYSAKYLLLELSTMVDMNEQNYFEIVKQMEFAKMKVSKTYPYMTLFLDQSAKETDPDIISKIAEDRRIYRDKISLILKAGDIPNIAEKAHKDKIKKIVQYTIEGIVHDKSADGAEPDAIYREIKSLLDMVSQLTGGTVQTSTDGMGLTLENVAS